MATVFLNGAFLGPADARISAFDAGFQHAVGLFETMLGSATPPRPEHHDDGHAVPGLNAWVMGLEAHLERLAASARELGLAENLRTGPLAEAVLRTVERSGLPRARVRLTITGGDLNLLQAARAQHAADSATQPASPPAARPPGLDPTVLIVAQPATEYPPELFERGSTAVIADLRLNPLDPIAGHKTLNYWARLRELQAAAAKRAGEALVFQVTNHLAGGCVSSALLVKDGTLITPIARGEETAAVRGTGVPPVDTSIPPAPPKPGVAMPSPILPGVTRAWLLDWAAQRHVPVRRKMVTIDDVLSADELLLTNSSWGVMPIVRVERESIGAGGVGELTRDAIDAWRTATRVDEPRGS